MARLVIITSKTMVTAIVMVTSSDGDDSDGDGDCDGDGDDDYDGDSDSDGEVVKVMMTQLLWCSKYRVLWSVSSDVT